MYFRHLLPRLVKPGDDGNCGSAALCDTMCLQARSLACIITNGSLGDLKLNKIHLALCRYFQREFTTVNLLLRPSFEKILLPMKQLSENKYSHFDSC